MVDFVLPKDWQLPDWHPDFGDVKSELEELRSLAVSICKAVPGAMANLVTPEPGLMLMEIEIPSGVSVEIHSVPSTQDFGKRRFAIFVSPNSDNEIEEYASSEEVALEFLKHVAINR